VSTTTANVNITVLKNAKFNARTRISLLDNSCLSPPMGGTEMNEINFASLRRNPSRSAFWVTAWSVDSSIDVSYTNGWYISLRSMLRSIASNILAASMRLVEFNLRLAASSR
jgi:hypothetical protein